jgi:hypothetical protein
LQAGELLDVTYNIGTTIYQAFFLSFRLLHQTSAFGIATFESLKQYHLINSISKYWRKNRQNGRHPRALRGGL